MKVTSWPRLSFWILCFYGVNAACPSFNINYPPMRTLLCPGDIITYTCAINSNFNTILTQWTGSGFQCPATATSAANILTLSQTAGAALSTVPGSCGNLSAAMTNISGTCYTSVLTIPTPQYFSGTTVTCKDGTTGTLIGNDTLNIQLASPPNAPTIASLINAYSDQQRTVIVTWTSVPTATSYNVSINDSVNTIYNVSSTGAPSYMKNFTGLTNNTVYTVSVVAINCAGSSSTLQTINNMDIGPAGPSTTVAASSATPVSTPPPSSNNSIALGVGIGVGVGVPIVLAVILVIVGVVYCKGGNTRSKIRNEGASPDAGSPDHKGPSKPPRAKQTSPSGGEAPKPAAKPKEALMYADVGSVNTKSNGNKSAQTPANKKYDDGVAYSDIKH